MLLPIILVCFFQNALAQGIHIKKYYRSSCEDYAGTWEGVITDPTDLFADGGPWPVTVVLASAHGEIVGESSAMKYADGKSTFASRMIRARCSKGQLKDIYWGPLDSCGSLSQNGELVSKNMLVLQLNYENAMIGAEMYAFLQRKSNSYFVTRVRNLKPYDPKAVQSCH